VEAVVVKVGSSSVVGDDGRLRGEALDGLAAEVAELARAGRRPVLVSSGAVAAGVGVLGLARRPTELPRLQAASAVGQAALFAEWRRRFTALQVTPAQVLISSADLERRVPYLNARNLLATLIDGGVLPIVNENDATATEELTVGDNDRLAAHVAILLGAGLLVLLTGQPGVMADSPDGLRPIREVAAGTPVEALPLAAMPGSASGRGGIEAKLGAALMAADAGVTTVVAKGGEPGVVRAASSGAAVGTRFAASHGSGAPTPARELDRLAISWLSDVMVPRDVIERALGPGRIERRQVPAGTVIVEEGDVGGALYMIVGGEVEVTRSGATIAVLGPGELFGEMALLRRERRTATVRARTGANLLVLRAAAFRALVERVPELGARLREAARARDAEARLTGD
jgi:glutamate 5-kinase